MGTEGGSEVVVLGSTSMSSPEKPKEKAILRRDEMFEHQMDAGNWSYNGFSGKVK